MKDSLADITGLIHNRNGDVILRRRNCIRHYTRIHSDVRRLCIRNVIKIFDQKEKIKIDDLEIRHRVASPKLNKRHYVLVN